MTIPDSNIWIAYFNRKDSQHAKAVKVFDTRRKQKETVLITEYIVIEVCSVLAKVAGKNTANTFLDIIFDNNEIAFLPSQESFFLNVASLFREKNVKDLSFVDVSLLYLSAKYQVLTFDRKLERTIRMYEG